MAASSKAERASRDATFSGFASLPKLQATVISVSSDDAFFKMPFPFENSHFTLRYIILHDPSYE